MMFCVELDAELVNTFCEEAGMLAQLQHHNVVRLEGLCVVPPALCLVMELCEFGSLYSFLREMAGELSWRQRLSLCADCARAVAFLHQQSPPLLHMDIKRCEQRRVGVCLCVCAKGSAAGVRRGRAGGWGVSDATPAGTAAGTAA